MQKITISDFSGGIQEAYSPDDFTERQWSILRGVVPRDDVTFESQWPAQMVGTLANVSQVFPLESSAGTFLVAIDAIGRIYWTKPAPASGPFSIHTNSAASPWYEITVAENKGVNRLGGGYAPVSPSPAVPNIPVTRIPAYRFITGLPFEVYKYVKQPFPGREIDVYQDRVFDSLVDTDGDGTYSGADPGDARSVCPGVLIGFRRSYRVVNGVVTFGVFNADGALIPPGDQRILVAYVDPKEATNAGTQPGWDGNPIVGTVKVVSFPHFRRWPVMTDRLVGSTLVDPIVGTWPATTVNGVSYAASGMRPGVTPHFIKPSTTEGETSLDYATSIYPFPKNPDGSPAPSGTPGPITCFHPYTYLTGVNALQPGNGIIPRASVGTMWNNQLILGDIEWRSDGSTTAADKQNRATIPPNGALVGPLGLTDGNTEPHRGSFYYSEADIDEFDPRSVVRASSSDARIAGMHTLDNRLICITTAGGQNDGVISFSGNLGQLHPYDETVTPNPFAIRKQLIRGGVGVADYEDDGRNYSNQTCLWSEVGVVVFIDKLGGVFYTDGAACDRLDRFGPRQPRLSSYYDHVASVGKHLLAWRSGRLLVMSIMESSGGAADGCWTELIAPENANRPDHIRSMVGAYEQVFMVVKGTVWRYIVSGLSTERGKIAGQEVDIVIATPTMGDHVGHRRTNWHRTGVSFYTEGTCTLVSVTSKAEAALNLATPPPTPNPAPVPSYTVQADKTYTNGHYDFVCPVGVGPQTVLSVQFVFRGNVIFQGVSVWGTGGFMERGEPE